MLSAGIKKISRRIGVPSLILVNRTLLGKNYADKLSVPLVISGGVTEDQKLF